MVDILNFVADKDEITTEVIVSHFGFTPTTAKRYLRQLTEFGYLESHGGNKNRTYTKKVANKWEQNETCFNYAERKQARPKVKWNANKQPMKTKEYAMREMVIDQMSARLNPGRNWIWKGGFGIWEGV